jgi:uncharacterized protein (TIGR02284 family)
MQMVWRVACVQQIAICLKGPTMAKETPLHSALDASNGQGLPGMGLALGDAGTIDTLNTLLEATRDGDYGFTTAAGYTDSPQLKMRLDHRASECREAGQELEALIVRLGGAATEGGSAAGALHRGWVSVRGTLGHYSDEAMLEECERGEDAEMAAYIKALTSNLSPGVRSVVERQAQVVRRNRGEVQSMRATLHAGHR